MRRLLVLASGLLLPGCLLLASPPPLRKSSDTWDTADSGSSKHTYDTAEGECADDSSCHHGYSCDSDHFCNDICFDDSACQSGYSCCENYDTCGEGYDTCVRN